MTAFVVSFVIWALLHSISAAASVKRKVRQLMGERAYEGLYRLLYNLFAIITFLPVLYFLATQVPRTLLWAIPHPFHLVAYTIQLGGMVGLMISLWQTDIWDFVGVRQAARYLGYQEESSSPPRLVTHGMYAFVRHPLYFFSLLVLWFNPVITLDTFLFNILATLYFWIGTRYEERRLAAFFGDAYRQYQQSVPYLFPLKLNRFRPDV